MKVLQLTLVAVVITLPLLTACEAGKRRTEEDRRCQLQRRARQRQERRNRQKMRVASVNSRLRQNFLDTTPSLSAVLTNTTNSSRQPPSQQLERSPLKSSNQGRNHHRSAEQQQQPQQHQQQQQPQQGQQRQLRQRPQRERELIRPRDQTRSSRRRHLQQQQQEQQQQQQQQGDALQVDEQSQEQRQLQLSSEQQQQQQQQQEPRVQVHTVHLDGPPSSGRPQEGTGSQPSFSGQVIHVSQDRDREEWADPGDTGYQPIPQNYTDRQLSRMERERARQRRFMQITMEIQQRLRVETPSSPINVTIDEDALAEYMAYMDPERLARVTDEPQDYLSKTFECRKPSCERPRNSGSRWEEQGAFRLYFKLEPERRVYGQRNNLQVANLRLYKKPLPDDCDCRGNSGRGSHRQRHRGTRTADDASRQEDDDDDVNVEEEEEEEEDGEENQLRVTIWQYLKPVKRGRKKDKRKMVATDILTRDMTGWVRLNVSEMVAEWLKKPKKNFGLEVEVTDASGNQIDPFTVFEPFNCTDQPQNRTFPFPEYLALNESLSIYNSTYPVLDLVVVLVRVMEEEDEELESRENVEEVEDAGRRDQQPGHISSTELQEGGLNRRRGNSRRGNNNNNNNRRKRDIGRTKKNCFREKMYISFSDIGWSDRVIVQPQGFEAGFCVGTCSPLHNDKHAVKYFQKNRLEQYECCGPTKLKPLSLLHFNDHKLMISVLDDFIITSCGCRP